MYAQGVTVQDIRFCLTTSRARWYGGSMLKFVLLALMSDGKPAHGYALMKAYEERSGLRVSIGNIYRELQRLLAEGSIVSAANPPGADPRRTPYAITAQGRQDLAS